MHPRNFHICVALAAASAVSLAVSLQVAWDLSACTLCILQRYLYLALAASSVLCAFTTGRKPWLTGLSAVWALAGAATAARNIWVIYVPSITCGRDKLATVVNGLPPAQYWPTLFEANGLCSESPAAVAGVPFPILSFVTFAVLLVAVGLAHRSASRRVTQPSPY